MNYPAIFQVLKTEDEFFVVIQSKEHGIYARRADESLFRRLAHKHVADFEATLTIAGINAGAEVAK